jgi:predicted nucleic acid-binding protein
VAFPALLDACVLIPIRLTDLLLRLAEAGTYRLLWSHDVLDEVERNLPKVGVDPDKARTRVQQMRDAFPDALVTDYGALIPAMTNHQKDRHVLAAAVRADAAVIVTANIKDFPPPALQPYDIDAVHPDDFLLDQLDLYPAQTMRCIREQVADCQNPAITTDHLLGTLGKTVPRFADQVREQLNHEN